MKTEKTSSEEVLKSESIKPINKKTISRKCPGCGSIINSPILEQCPICNEKLEKISKEEQIKSTQTTEKSTGFIFTNKKLIPERKLVLKKDIWNLREGISVFGNSLMAYITIRLLIIMLLTGVSVSEELGILSILLSQIPEIVFGVYPLWYIYSKKHSFKKLGFESNKKSIIFALIIGIFASFIYYEISYFSDLLVNFMYNSGLTLGIDLPSEIALENQVIRESGHFGIIILLISLIIGTISTEIVFRGVLHKTLRNHFENNFFGRATVIMIVALIYSLLFLVFFLPISIYFFFLNFFSSILLGIIFEINNNIYNTIFTSIFYNIVIVILIGFF